jgi:hypothetical protein
MTRRGHSDSCRLARVISVLWAVCLLGGCAATSAPTTRDPDYPKSWSPLVGLGEECKSLDGKYKNIGILVNAKGVDAPLRLTDLLFATGNDGRPSHDAQDAYDAVSISLSVWSKHVDTKHDTIGSLGAIVDVSGRTLKRTLQSGCIGQVLVFAASSAGVTNILGFTGAQQQNVWLSFSQDGSLVAKIGNIRAGTLLVLVPYGQQSVAWARFEKY